LVFTLKQIRLSADLLVSRSRVVIPSLKEPRNINSVGGSRTTTGGGLGLLPFSVGEVTACLAGGAGCELTAAGDDVAEMDIGADCAVCTEARTIVSGATGTGTLGTALGG
jgi:hypothetical protein